MTRNGFPAVSAPARRAAARWSPAPSRARSAAGPRPRPARSGSRRTQPSRSRACTTSPSVLPGSRSWSREIATTRTAADPPGGAGGARAAACRRRPTGGRRGPGAPGGPAAAATRSVTAANSRARPCRRPPGRPVDAGQDGRQLGHGLVAERRQLVGRRGRRHRVECLDDRLVRNDRLLVATPEQDPSAGRATRRAASAARRDLPIPASPVTTTTWRAPAGACVPRGGQHPELGLSPDERHHRPPAVPGRGGRVRLVGIGRRRVRRRCRAEQGEVGGLGLRRGIDAELVGQRPPQPLVGPQRLGPVAAGLVGRHQGPVCPLVQRGRATAASAAATAPGPPRARRGVAGHQQGADDQVVERGRTSVRPRPGVAGEERCPHRAATAAPARTRASSGSVASAARASASRTSARSTSTTRSTSGREGELVAAVAGRHDLAGPAEHAVSGGGRGSRGCAGRRPTCAASPRATRCRRGGRGSAPCHARARGRQHHAGAGHGLTLGVLATADGHVAGERDLQSHRPPRSVSRLLHRARRSLPPGRISRASVVVTCRGARGGRLRDVCGVDRMMRVNGEQPRAITQFVADRGG